MTEEGIALRLGPGGIQEAIPVTAEILLNPSLDVQILQSGPHDHKLRWLAGRLEPFLRSQDRVVHCDVGLDIPSVIAHVNENQYLEGFPGADSVTNAELLELPCDVLVPAAIENQITGANADRLRCRLLVEGANGPTDLEADAILSERGVHVVPDILANAGGVTVSYFEWIQNSQQLFWSEEEVNDRLIALMQQVYRRVHEASETRGLDMRSTALQLGIERIAAAKRTRGVFP